MTVTKNTRRDTKSQAKRTEREWRSFPTVPNLLQYVSNGNYYARLKVNGKLLHRSLGTKVFSDAKLLLHDFITRESKRRHVSGTPETFGQAQCLYESSIESDATLAPQSLYYRKNCIKRLLKSWPGLDKMKPRAITRQQCERWGSALAAEVDAQYFNNILATFKFILARAGVSKETGSPLFDDQGKPTVKRMGIEQVPPTLPEPEQFMRIIEAMETSGAGQQQECADFARFLAYSGCRLSEARAATWADVDLAGGMLTVHNAKVRRARSHKETRLVPIIPDMRVLLERLNQGNPKETDPICTVGECEKSLVRACKIVEIPKLTHHDLRHLFATRCIEARVDIPTVSRWLGHSDGGALAMKVYGHLREKHSAEMAQRVTFSPVETSKPA